MVSEAEDIQDGHGLVIQMYNTQKYELRDIP